MASASIFRHRRRAAGAAADGATTSRKQRPPRLDDDEETSRLEDSLDFGNDALQIVRQRRQVMEPALHDRDVVARLTDGKRPAVADHATRATSIQRHEPLRQVDAMDVCEPELLERDETRCRARRTAPESVDILGQPSAPSSPQSADELPDLLVGRLEAE